MYAALNISFLNKDGVKINGYGCASSTKYNIMYKEP